MTGPDVGPGSSLGAEAERRRAQQVRAFLRANRDLPSLRETVSKIAYQVYVVFLIGGLWGVAVYRALRDPSAVRAVLSPAALDAVPVVAVGLALLLTIAGMRLGTWAGPVLVSRPEAAWLLPAPLDRRRLLRPDLTWGLVGFGVVGALLGLIGGIVVALETPAGVAEPVVGATVGWAAIGVMTGVAALAVEASPRLARAAMRGTAVLVLVALGVAVTAAQAPEVAVWIPPWGWAAMPLVDAAVVAVPLPWLPVGGLVVVAAVAVRWALRRLDSLPDEELIRRAGVASGVRASAAVFDARAIAQGRRTGQQRLVGHRNVRLPRPRHRWQLLLWRDAVSLLRRRGLPERVLVAVGVATVLLVWSGQHAGAAVLAVLILSTTAGTLLEPMRIELEEPVAGDLTPFAPHELVLEHLVVPVAALAIGGVLAVVITAASGVMPWTAVPAALPAVLVGAAVTVTVAALAATRGAAPLHLLVQGEYGAVLLAGWALAGPLLAVLVLGPLVLVGVNALGQGMPVAQALQPSEVLGVAVAAGLALATRYRARKRTEG